MSIDPSLPKLDLTSLKNANGQLAKALRYSHSPLAESDEGIFEQFRNSVVQCFEYTFELSIKMIRRYLEQTSDSASNIDALDFKDLLREAALKNLLSDPTLWFEFRRLRNLSSHAYDQSKAESVYLKAQALYDASCLLISKIESK